MTLKPEERKAIVAYRLDKSKETLEEGKTVGKIGYWSLAANRLYYAAYYACIALLIDRGIEASTHKGTIRMIGYTFVKDNILRPEDSQLLGRLFSMRQTGDYEDLFDWTEDDVYPLIPKVAELINRIERIIQENAQL